ncbi:MAG: NAD-dependent epimerase/dehydratase family protein [Chloroflexota bacterium]
MKVLVIGGTGYLGRRILERLLEARHDVAVVSRGNLAPDVLTHVRPITVDRRDRAAFTARLSSESFDAVIDNIAYDRDDVENAVQTFGGRIQQYLFTSSMAVYHDASALDPLVESDADLNFLPGPTDTHIPAFHPTLGHEYGNGKKRAEKALGELADSVFRFTALRAPIVVGPDDRTRRIWWFVQRLQDGGPIVIPEWGRDRQFQVIHADDLARAFVACLGNPAAYGKAYNVAQPELFTAESWVTAFGRALGVNASSVRIPEDIIASAGLRDYVLPIAGIPFGQFIMDTCRLRGEIGFQFSKGEDWIQDCADGCATSPPSGDSAGYDRRDAEIRIALQIQAVQNDALQRLRDSLI